MFPAIRAAILVAVASFTTPMAAANAELEHGRAVYNFRCYFCHGYSGDARTLAATYLSPPPANFRALSIAQLDRVKILAALRNGRPGTAMKSFTGVLDQREMEAVAAFVENEFVIRKAANTSYHTVENGWPSHDRYRAAFPFATGEIPLSRPWENLSPQEAAGKRLYLGSCISCHDRGAPDGEAMLWDARPLSYPRNNYLPGSPAVRLDAIASASPYALHEIPPKARGLNAQERRGERLFQSNCAFCHGADGTGKNWIGQFLEPHPRNLRNPAFMSVSSRESIARAIREGLPGTSMPAWKQVLSESDIAAIIAYIHRVFHPLAGTLSAQAGPARPPRTSATVQPESPRQVR